MDLATEFAVSGAVQSTRERPGATDIVGQRAGRRVEVGGRGELPLEALHGGA